MQTISELWRSLLPLVQQEIAKVSSRAAGASGGLATHALDGAYHSGSLGDSQAPQFAKLDGSRAFTGNLTFVGAQTVDGVDISAHAVNASAHHAPVTAGTLIGLSGQQVSVANGSAQYQVPVTGASPFAPAFTALSGMAGDGLTFGSGAFAVGAGTLISVGANDISLANGSAQYQVPVTGASPFTPAFTALSGMAGDGLTFGSGAFAVGVANTGATGLTVEANAVRLTSSNNTGAAAAILATDATGTVTVPHVVGGTDVATPALKSSAALAITSSAGDISLDASTNAIKIGASNTVKADNYASQTTGWAIDYDGGADFRYLFTDELHAKSFIADLEQALAGGQIISKSVAIIAVDFTVPAAGAAATLRVKDLPSAANMAVFQSGDIVRLRTFSRASGSLTIANCWGVVTSYADQSDGTQTWTFTRSSGSDAGSISTGATIRADSLALDYGTSGNGFYEVNAIDGTYAANSPYWQIVSWTGHPATGSSVKARGGKLTGIFSVANEYGLFAGTGTGASDSYLRLSSYTQESNNLSSTWKTGGSTFLSIDATNGVQIESINSLTSSNQRAYSFTIAGAESGGLYHYYNNTYTEAVMMLNQLSASRNNNIFVQTESDSGKNSRIYLEAKETTQATAYIDLQADVGGNVSEIQMGAYTISAYTSQILVKYANGSGGDGFASAPVYSFVDDTNTGIYRSAADQLDISTGGTSRVTITTSAFAAFSNVDSQNIVGKARIGYIGNADGAGFQHYDMPVNTSSYALLQQATGRTYLNCSSTTDIRFRHANTDVMAMNDVGLRIGSATAATQALDVTGNAYFSGNTYTGGIIESGQAVVSGNLSNFTARNGTASAIGLTSTSYGKAGALLFNAYRATGNRLSSSGACKYLGTQYTGNVTAPGMFYYDANSNRFEWWIGEQGLASGDDITSWQQQLQLDSAGKMTLFGDLEWSSGGFAAAWTALTYNTGWGSYGSPYKAMSYCRIGDWVLVNGLVLRSSGTSSTIGTLPSGYRPTTNKVFDARANINSAIVSIQVDIDTSGNIAAVNLAGGDTVGFISLDNIQFRTNS